MDMVSNRATAVLVVAAAAVDLLLLLLPSIVVRLTVIDPIHHWHLVTIAGPPLRVAIETHEEGMIGIWTTEAMIEEATTVQDMTVEDMIVEEDMNDQIEDTTEDTVETTIEDMIAGTTEIMAAGTIEIMIVAKDMMADTRIEIVTVVDLLQDAQERSGTDEDRLGSKTLYVGNIPYSFREPEVENMFKKFGAIAKVTVVLDQYTGRNKGFAFVEYEDRKDAEEALEQFNGFDVQGRRLKLDWDIGLVKKDIKPSRSTGTTTENSTAETSPQPYTRTATEASTPVDSEATHGPLDPSAVAALAATDATKATGEQIQRNQHPQGQKYSA
ncbi:hypothetical protein BGZ65_010663 [Modicella reniformis]|uniref:RRM domain-containing protein n=1 Tax=Modicella reniformis TaxID=1440133 RepID=A0A9P6SRE2_9FUNG|nr:hypothetical protein BGZ65_010663 [Modicella reniformis]